MCNEQHEYGNLKGKYGYGSLPIITRPEEFGQNGQNHTHEHVIIQSIIMVQYNLKQEIRKYDYKG